MDIIAGFINNISHVEVMELISAICIILLFRFSSSTKAYIIVKIFKFDEKSKKRIKESAFYKPIRDFFNLLGIYLAVLVLRKAFYISEDAMDIITKIFEICGVIAFSRGLAASFLPKSSLVKRIKQRTNSNVEDSMFDFVLKIVRAFIYVLAIFAIITILGVNLNGLIAGLGLRRSNCYISSTRYSKKFIWRINNIYRQTIYSWRLDRNGTIWGNSWRYYI